MKRGDYVEKCVCGAKPAKLLVGQTGELINKYITLKLLLLSGRPEAYPENRDVTQQLF